VSFEVISATNNLKMADILKDAICNDQKSFVS